MINPCYTGIRVCMCIYLYVFTISDSSEDERILSFLLPALIHIDGKMTADKKHSGLNVFIMVPTKKSALEIRKKVQKYSYHDIKA